MATYKGFTYNLAGSPKPPGGWGTVENQLDFDLIDNIVGDCITALSDTTGHKHDKLYNTISNVGVRVNGQGDIRLEYDAFNYITFGINSSGNLNITPSGGNVGIGVSDPDVILEVYSTTSPQFKISYDGSNYTTFDCSSGGNLTIAPSGGNMFLTGSAYAINSTTTATMYISSDTDDNSADADAKMFFYTNGAPGSGTAKGNIGYDEGDDRLVIGYGSNKDVYIDTDGDTGFGISVPTAVVDIKSPGGGNYNALQVVNSQDTDPLFAIFEEGSNHGMAYLYNASGAARVQLSSTDSYPNYFMENVGIGISSLDSWDGSYNALQLGTAGALMANESTGQGFYILSNQFYDGTWKARKAGVSARIDMTSGAYIFYTAASEPGDGDEVVDYNAMTILNGGNVGIGVSDPDTPLEILYTGNQLKLSYDGTDNATFAVDTNGYMTITPSGSSIGLNVISNVSLLNIGGTKTAVTAFAIGLRHGETLTASADNDGLYTVFGNATYNDSGYSGVKHYFLYQQTEADNYLQGNVGIGTATPDRLLHVEVEDAVTNAVTYVSRFSHFTSGTADDGIGVGLEFEVEGMYGTDVYGELTCTASSSTGDGKMNIRAYDVTATGVVDVINADPSNVVIGNGLDTRLGIGVTPTQKFEIGSTNNSDRISIYHSNVHANIDWDDGFLKLNTVETGQDTVVTINETNTQGVGYLRVYNQDSTQSIQLIAGGSEARMRGNGCPLSFQHTAEEDVYFFSTASAGETPTIQISGRNGTDTVRRTLSIGMSSTVDDQVDFTGLSTYEFTGDLNESGVRVATGDGTTGGTGSAGAGNQYIEISVAGTTYKVLHDGTV